MFRPYVQALRTQGALLPLVASFVGGGLPIGMLTLAVLLLVRLQSGSFLGAGMMAAALTAGNAAGVAVQGVLIDRRGQTLVLVPASLICLSSLVALVAVTTRGGPPALDAGLAVVGGAAIPATPSSMRVLWAALVADPRLRVTAYALSAVSFTAATILGPVLVSGLLLFGGPQVAVVVAASLAGGGGSGCCRVVCPQAAHAPTPRIGTGVPRRTVARFHAGRPGAFHDLGSNSPGYEHQ